MSTEDIAELRAGLRADIRRIIREMLAHPGQVDLHVLHSAMGARAKLTPAEWGAANPAMIAHRWREVNTDTWHVSPVLAVQYWAANLVEVRSEWLGMQVEAIEASGYDLATELERRLRKHRDGVS